MKIEPGPHFATTDINGNYWFSVASGTYTVTCFPKLYWNLTTDSLIHTFYVSDSNLVLVPDIGLKPDTTAQDVRVNLTYGPLKPGFDSWYWIYYENLGFNTMNGTISYEYFPSLTYLNSTPAEDIHSGNILTYNYDTLINEEQRMIFSMFNVPAIMNIGDTVISYCSIEPITGDTNQVNNTDTLIQFVVGSWDPNDKSVSPVGIGVNGYVLHGQELTYTIRFQNTGTDTAYTVMIRDTLDPNMKIETFNLLASSHPVNFEIKDEGVVKFTFNNIMLPDSNVNYMGSNGFVKYSLKPKAGLADFTQVKNKAAIYFDYNQPVITNEVLNTYVSTISSVKETSEKPEIKVFPNPASDVVTLYVNNVTNNNLTINMYNVLGDLVCSKPVKQNLQQISVSGLTNGIYIVEVKGNVWSEKQKLVIQR